MLNKAIMTFVVLVATVLSGCSAIPMASEEKDAQVKSFVAHPEKANLYIYRNEFIGGAVRMEVEIDGKKVGQTGPKTYFALQVLPGDHTIVSKAENDSTLSVTTEAGKNYFVWQEVKMGILYARNKLQLVDEAAGKAGVAECKLIDVPN